jgi:transcription elongation factor Elf1
MDLDRADGPACPRCGCQDSEVVREPYVRETSPHVKTWAEKQIRGLAYCRFCGAQFQFLPEDEDDDTTTMNYALADPMPAPPPPEPPKKPIACPECGSRQATVYSTKPKKRYYRCHDCENRFSRSRRPIERVQ